MRTQVSSILILICLLLSSCSTATTQQSTPTTFETPTSTPSPTETLAATQTLTPEPTATFTETPLPRIALPILMENGKPVLLPDGRVQVEWTNDFSKLPTVQELGKKLGAEAWSPEFIAKWHDYLAHATVQGSPLVTNFPPTVCDVPWLTSVLTGINDRTELVLDSRVACKAGTFPVRPIAAFRDDYITLENGTVGFPLYALTMQVYDPGTKKFVFRTVAQTLLWDDVFYLNQKEGAYMTVSYGFPGYIQGSTKGYDFQTARALMEKKLRSGISVYEPVPTDAAFIENGIFDPRFDTHVIVGNRIVFRVTP